MTLEQDNKKRENPTWTIRVSVHGNKWAIKVKTQGLIAHGWTIWKTGYNTRFDAVQELRKLIDTGNYKEG
jgi:hypothetical protein